MNKYFFIEKQTLLDKKSNVEYDFYVFFYMNGNVFFRYQTLNTGSFGLQGYQVLDGYNHIVDGLKEICSSLKDDEYQALIGEKHWSSHPINYNRIESLFRDIKLKQIGI